MHKYMLLICINQRLNGYEVLSSSLDEGRRACPGWRMAALRLAFGVNTNIRPLLTRPEISGHCFRPPTTLMY